MTTELHRVLPLTMGLLALGGCDSSNPAGTCRVTPPAAWSAPEWDANTAEALALRAQLDALVGDTMRGAEQGTVTVDEVADLTALFEAGDPSLADVTTARYSSVVEDAFTEFVELIAAGSVDVVDAEGSFSPGTAGGLAGADTRGVNEGGLEVRQLVDKGVYAGAGLYAYALDLTAGPVDASTVDAIAAAWGANAQLDPAGSLTDSAGYSHSMGYHAATAEALIAARAYAADAGCAAERDEALRSVFALWEEAMFARFAYYLNVAVDLSTNAAGDDEYIDAIHELSEGIGLVAGFHGLESPANGPLSGGARVVADATIEDVLGSLGVHLDDLGASTTGQLVVDPASFGASQDEVEAALTDAFDLSASELASWITPAEG